MTMNNSNNKKITISKWLASLACGVAIMIIFGGVITAIAMYAKLSTLDFIEKEVGKNSQWIDDWDTKKKVPQRDMKQDVSIEFLIRQVQELQKDVNILQAQYNQLGGPKDPLFYKVQELETQIDKLRNNR